ncbi:MAG TPA: M50 family metallopeptidase [bacterium]|nr:M50 family metallopeptidase [bacterium]
MPTIVLAILALELMILVHELGHLVVAKRVGIAVHAFAIGFGPKLFAFTIGETTYSLNLLPVGGYVNMAGEDNETSSPDVPPERRFRAKSVGQRLAVVCAGPAMNFLLAIVLLAATAVSYGVPSHVSTRIDKVVPGDPAAQAGLRPGDVILAIDGRLMRDDGNEVIRLIHTSNGRTLSFLIQRGPTRFLVHVPTKYDPRQRVWLTGFLPQVVRSHLDPIRALGWGALTTGRDMVAYLTALGTLARSGQLLGQLGGPVTAVNVLGQAAHAGGETFLYFTAFFSIIIGLFNLFPLPALDGGRAAFLLVEGLRRRPVDPRREGYIHLVGLALLLCLILALTVRDIMHPVHLTLP